MVGVARPVFLWDLRLPHQDDTVRNLIEQALCPPSILGYIVFPSDDDGNILGTRSDPPERCRRGVDRGDRMWRDVLVEDT